MNLFKALAGAAVATVLGTAGAYAADVVIPGTGYSSSATGIAGTGNSGPDAFGNTWSWTNGSWYTPQFGGSFATYGSSTAAQDFHVIFLPGTSASIASATFDDVTSGQTWTSTLTANDLEVTFFAPAGQSLSMGDAYKIAVNFNNSGLDGSNTGFTAFFTTTGVPEASTWAMMALGFSGLAFAGLRSSRKQAEPRAIA